VISTAAIIIIFIKGLHHGQAASRRDGKEGKIASRILSAGVVGCK
jgi:hypothetical protein